MELPRGSGASVLADVLSHSDDVALLVDDADRLGASTEFHALLKGLAATPSNLRIVLTSRGRINFPLARREASGELLRIGPTAMLFDKAEEAAVIEPLRKKGFISPGVDLGLDNLAGWPLAVALQVHAGLHGIQPGEPSAGNTANRIVTGTWRLMDEYFEQEVISHLTVELTTFLVKFSILNTIKVQDCRELFGEKSDDLLGLAYDRGVPLWPIDPEHRGFEMLPVFRQFLRARLSQAQAEQLGRAVCNLLEDREDFSGASLIALDMGDHARAAELVERQLQTDFGLRDETRLLPLVERIDPKIRNEHPRILLAQSQYLTFKFEFEHAQRLLDKARAIVEFDSGRKDSDPDEIRALEMLLLHRDMVLALGRHDLALAQDLGGKLLSGMENVPPAQRVMLLASLIYAQQELYIFRGADRYYAQGKKLITSLDSWIWSVPLETFYARHLFETGRTDGAVALLEGTLRKLIDELGPRPVFGSIVAIALAEMKFEVRALEEAEELLSGYSDHIETFGYLSLIVAARVTRARIHMARGESEAAFAVLDRPAISAGELFDKLSRSLNVERTYWTLRRTHEGAARLARSGADLLIGKPPNPHSSAGRAEEASAIAWIQLARAERHLDEAIVVAQKWQRYTEGVGAVRSNVRWHVILATLRTFVEEPRSAMRHLRRAVQLGAEGHYRAPFLDEVEVLREQLSILAESGSDLSPITREFVRGIIGLPETQPSAADNIDLPLVLGAFSSREIAILRLVARGHTNKKIGATLGMTEGTVKWYLHKIYDMLGIRRRSQIAMLVSQMHLKSSDADEPESFDDDD